MLFMQLYAFVCLFVVLHKLQVVMFLHPRILNLGSSSASTMASWYQKKRVTKENVPYPVVFDIFFSISPSHIGMCQVIFVKMYVTHYLHVSQFCSKHTICFIPWLNGHLVFTHSFCFCLDFYDNFCVAHYAAGHPIYHVTHLGHPSVCPSVLYWLENKEHRKTNIDVTFPKAGVTGVPIYISKVTGQGFRQKPHENDAYFA